MPKTKTTGKNRNNALDLHLANDEPQLFHMLHQLVGIVSYSNGHFSEDDNASCALE